MIPKGTTHVFWTTVESGAREGAEATGLELVWKGPLQENDRAQQIDLVNQYVAQRVRGIVLAPLDHRALVRPVAAAREAGIPVVIFDSALDGTAPDDFACFVGTNNLEAGRMAGAHLAGLIQERGEVVVLRYLVGSASTEDRERGFLESVGVHEDVEITVEDRYAGATAGEAKTTALNVVDRLRTASGIFCSNESATMGMLLALRQAGLAGTKRFVGFDASPPLVEALRSGEIDALVVQDPRGMGRASIEAMATILEGGSVAPLVDTAVVVVTRDNVDDPEVARLLK